MRIALVVPEYPPDVLGGGGAVFRALARKLHERHDVRVFSGWDSVNAWGHRPVVEERDGITIHRYPLLGLSRRRPYLRSVPPPSMRSWRSLRADLTGWRPDVAHLHGYGGAFVDVAARQLHHAGVPYVFTLHGLPVTPRLGGRGTRLAYRVYERFGAGKTLERAAVVTAVSRSAVSELRTDREVLVIPHGIDDIQVPALSEDERSKIRERLEVGLDDALLVGAGRLQWLKGFDVLLRSLDHVKQATVCLLFGDDGGAGVELERLAESVPDRHRVRFEGRLDHDALLGVMSVADIVIVPSLVESFGLVISEALSAGCRVIATSVVGIAEFLEPGQVELVPPGDPTALGAAIEEALLRDAPTPHQTTGQRRMELTWANVAARYEEILATAGGRSR